MQPEVRVSIAGYRDLVRVGSGGFSMVYRAYQEAFDRTVAVKVLTVELVDENAQRRFQRECRASGRLSNHPNIVTVLDSGFTDDGRPFITTEFMSNGSLADRLDEGRTYSVTEVLDLGVKMCSALAAVHAAGILHRDIKPPNILMSDYDEPALADFGISAITVGPEASIGTSSLTPLHVAPEVLEGQPTSAASDVYSLGSTMYTLLAGRAPFQLTDDDALMPLMRRVVSDPVPEIGRDDIPSAVMDLLRYSMEKQPFSRYGTAVAFGEAIQATQAHLGYPVTPLRKPGTRPGDFVLPPPIATTAEPLTPPASSIVGDASVAGFAAPAVTSDHPPAAADRSGPPPHDTGNGAAPGSTGPEDPQTSADASPRSKTPLLVGLAVLVVVALVGGAALVLTRGDGTGTASPTGATGTNGAGSGGGDPAQAAAVANPRFDVESNQLDTAAPSPGGTLRVALDAEPQTWNPAASRFYTSSRLVADAVFDPLAVLTTEGPKPYLATALTPNAGYDEWVIELPTGVKFHDGSVLDAAAVKANFDARLNDELLGRTLSPVRSVTVEGTRVRVSLSHPWPAFPAALAGQSGLIALPSYLTASEDAYPVGTGPFAFVGWERGSKIEVKKFAEYRIPDRPYLDGIEFSLIPDNAARTSALASGQTDVAFVTDPTEVDRTYNEYSVLVSTQALVATIIFNTTAGPTSDLRLRQALGFGTDLENLNEGLFDGKARSAGSPFPYDSPWMSQDTSRRGYDIDEAKRLMAELGYSPERPLALSLLVGSSPRQTNLGQLLQTQWRQIGVEVTVKSDGDTVTPVLEGDFEAATWTYDVATDPDDLYVWFHTDANPGSISYNLPRISDSNLDRGFDNGRKEADLAKRKAAYATVEQELIDQAPALWLAYLPTALVAAPRVVGWQPETSSGVGRGGTPWATTIGFK